MAHTLFSIYKMYMCKNNNILVQSLHLHGEQKQILCWRTLWVVDNNVCIVFEGVLCSGRIMTEVIDNNAYFM